MWQSADSWKKRLEARILQEPLIETRPSLEALHRSTRRSAPRAVLVGVGLCSSARLAMALPMDVLGMLLPAEHLRRELGARSLIVLIADEHALSNRFDPLLVRRRADALCASFVQIRHALGLRHMSIVRASSFHHTQRYRVLLEEVERRAPSTEHCYVKKQVADAEYLDRVYHGVLKIGWTIGPGAAEGRCDEPAFDARVRAYFGSHMGFVYCKAGRKLDDARPKAVPYVALEPDLRICIQSDENVLRKLERAQLHCSADTVNGYRNHLRAMAYSFSKHIAPLSGPLEHRLQTILARIVSVPRHTGPSAPRRHAPADYHPQITG